MTQKLTRLMEDELQSQMIAFNIHLEAKIKEHLFEHFAQCRVLMILIDPARTAVNAGHHEQSEIHNFVPQQGAMYNHQRTYRELLFQLFEDLREYNRQNNGAMPHIAFCMTKADANDYLWFARHQASDFWDSSTDIHRNSEMNVIAQHLGDIFMEQQLPSLISTEQVRGFLVSAIGRQKNNEPNISTGHTWQRPQTPRPPLFNSLSATLDLPSVMNRASIVLTYRPQSIFNPNKIQPHNLIQPILWLLLQLQKADG